MMLQNRNRFHLLFFTILILGSGWIYASRLPIDAQTDLANPEPAIGHPAPLFTLTTLDGERFELTETPQSPIVLNFWATWCGPCRDELPALQAAAERYGEQVQIVAVDQAEPTERVQKYVDELGLTFTIPMDTDNAVANRYNVSGMPTTFFIDADRIIQHMWTGEMNSITLAEGIDLILPR